MIKSALHLILSIILILLSNCLLLDTLVYAADLNYDWTQTVGGTANEGGSGVTTDSDGNVYITGYFNDTVDFDPTDGTDSHSSNGFYDMYISQYRADGSYGWTQTVGGGDFEQAYTVAVDKNDNVYVVGVFRGTVDFDPTDGIDSRTSNGGFDIFVSQYQTDGSYGWTQTVGGTENDYGYSLAVDDSGNIYVTGLFRGTVDFDPTSGTDSHSSNGSGDIFISQYQTDGSYGWTQTVGGTDFDEGYSIVADNNGNVYIAGDFRGTVDFDPTDGIDSRTSNGGFDIFVSQYQTDGSYGWTQTVGGAGDDYGNSVAIDDSGNIYVTGLFRGTVDFDPTSGTDSHSSNGSGDIFISQYQTDGSYGWTQTVGGTDFDEGYSIVADNNGNVYIAGDFRGTVDFDPTDGIDSRTSNGGFDIFVSQYQTDGSYGWTQTVGGAGDDYGNSVAIDDSSNIYVTGYFPGEVDFDPTSGTDSHSSNGSNDIFISQYQTDGSYGWTQTVGGTGSDIGNSVAVDDSRNVYITGVFSDTVDFDPSSETDIASSIGGFDIFISKYLRDTNEDSSGDSTISTTAKTSFIPDEPSAPRCNAIPPTSVPNLFEIRTTSTSATIYFVPAGRPLNKYFLAYSTSQNEYQHGLEWDSLFSTGVMSVTIDHLAPSTTYYLSLRAGHDCATGEWSNPLEISTTTGVGMDRVFYAYLLEG